MLEITPDNATAYLQERGWLPRRAAAQVAALAWGVSNVVLRVTPEGGTPFVLKQSRTQLRTRDPWFSRLDRIWREADAMRLLHPLLPAGVVPRVLDEDRDNYLFLMEAAPADHAVWKQRLLAGEADPGVAAFLGGCLATLHRDTARRADLAERFGDTEVFIQLRVDPFYRRVAQAAPDVEPQIDRLIAGMFSSPVCLVHADFSPKNVLLAGDRVVLVDYETAHYGDPAFDLGFFLSHLLLKAILHRRRFDEYAGLTTAFWREYRTGVSSLAREPEFAGAELVRRTAPHLAGCLWARIDGTSKVDYLPEPADQQLVRDFCCELFHEAPADWDDVLDRLRQRVGPDRAHR